jgi:hypothetical protein
MPGAIDEIDTGGFERVRAQVSVGHLADFMHRQARGNGHALRAMLQPLAISAAKLLRRRSAAGKRDSPAP